METTPFFIALFFHLVGLVLGLGSVLVTDLFGMLWMFDRVRFPQLVRVSGITEKFIWTGWGLMVAAGIPLVLLKGEVDNLMTIKLCFVALIGINGIFLNRLHKKLEQNVEGKSVANLTMFRLALALFVSQLSWWSAMLIGFLHRHVQTIIDWPDRPWLMVTLIFGGLLTIWIVGETLLKTTHKHVGKKRFYFKKS